MFYIFRLNDEKEWVKIKKTCETLEEAKKYVLDHKYQYSMISTNKELYHCQLNKYGRG